MKHEEYTAAAEYWTQRDQAGVPMPREELLLAVEAYIRANDTCALATGSGTFVRCTPLEYRYRDGAFWIFSEGGQKFRGLEENPNVSLAIFESYTGFGSLHSVQITGRAEVVEPFSADYGRAAADRQLSLEALRTLPRPMHLLKIQPVCADYLDGGLKKQGYSPRQHLEINL